MSKPQSKRRSERIPVTVPVRWIRRGGNVETTAADINLHGMFLLSSDTSVCPGQLMQVQVVLPESVLEMFVIARFVGRTEGGLGIGVEIFLMDELAQTKWAHHYRGQAARRRAIKTVVEATR